MDHPERGSALPVALLLAVGLTGLATSVFVLARGEAVLELGDLRYLSRLVSADRVLSEAGPSRDGGEGDGSVEEGPPGADDPLGADPVRPGDPSRVHATDLGHGFILLRSTGLGPGPMPMAVRWVLDRDAVLRGLPGAGETGIAPEDLPAGAVVAGCPGEGVGTPLLRVRPGTDTVSSGSGPSLPPHPRLGLLGVEALGALPGARSILDRTLPTGIAILRVSSGDPVRFGSGAGILLAPGDLRLEGDASFRGLALVGGDLFLAGQSVLEGVALVGGTIQIEDGARLVGCMEPVRDALDLPGLVGLHPVPGGARLGRY